MVAFIGSKWRPLPLMDVIIATGCCQERATMIVINGTLLIRPNAAFRHEYFPSGERSSGAERVCEWVDQIKLIALHMRRGDAAESKRRNT